MRRALDIAICAVLALGPLAGAAAGAQEPPSGVKRTFAIAAAAKGGLTDEDREAAGRYLAARGRELRGAPARLVEALSESKQWTAAHLPFATPVPSRLERRLAPPAEGTVRVIFNRSLYVIDAETGRVLDRVDPNE